MNGTSYKETKNRKRNTVVEMEETEFENLLSQANLSKKDFLEITGYHLYNLYRWAGEKRYPPYIKNILIWAVKSRKYKEIENELNIENNKETEEEKKLNELKIKELKEKNLILKDEIKRYEELEKLYNQIFKT